MVLKEVWVITITLQIWYDHSADALEKKGKMIYAWRKSDILKRVHS